MVASPRPRYYPAYPRTVVVYRNRRAEGTYASAPARRQNGGVIPARINTASDSFADSAQPVRLHGNGDSAASTATLTGPCTHTGQTLPAKLLMEQRPTLHGL